MYLDRAVLIPKRKGISYKKKGESNYVQYETGHRYDPEKQYSIPERVLIGIQIPAEPEMMLPNENYLRIFADEMEKADGIRKELTGEYEDERQERYILRELFLSTYHEFQNLSRRTPGEVVNEAKVERLNKLLTPLKKMLEGEKCSEYLELIEMPEKEEGNGEEGKITGMSYSDVAIILNHYKNLLNRYFRKRF